MNNIGNVIAKLRKSNEMTQEELALKVGVSAQTISKWETGNTMPDILLLPVIADVFDVTIDFLYGRDSKGTVLPIERNNYSEKVYKEFINIAIRSFIDTETSSDVIREKTKEKIENLEKNPQCQLLVKYGEQGGLYANKDLGIVWRNNNAESLLLLENESVEQMLTAFSEQAFRKILLYQIQNPTASFTAASVAEKCGIETTDAVSALEKLIKHNFTRKMSVDLGDETVDVFHFYSSHKMSIVFTMLSLAERLANYVEWYEGLNT